MKQSHYRSFGFTLIIVMGLFSCNSCSDKLNPYHYGPYLEEGEKLESEHISANQPTSRAEYSKFITISLYSGVGIVRINEDKMPELIKTIDTRMRMSHAKLDREGLLWIAAPFGINDYLPERQIYVIDPYTERVHKRIDLPEEMERPSFFVFYDDKVYVRGDRDGCSVGIGVIDRNDYSNKLLFEIENAGYEIETGMYRKDNNIFINCSWACTNPDSSKIIKYNPSENLIIDSSQFGNHCVFDKEFIYSGSDFLNIPEPRLYKVDYDFVPISYISLKEHFFHLVQNNEFVFPILLDGRIQSFAKDNLEFVQEIVPPSGYVLKLDSYNTGFVTNDILSINLNHLYKVSENKFYPNYFGLNDDGGGQNPPQLPEGYTLADYD